MQTETDRSRLLCMLVITLLFLMVSSAVSVAQNQPAKQIAVENQEWTVHGDTVIITYDLVAPANETYKVTVSLLNEEIPSFRIEPGNLKGDIGEGKFAGKGRTIIWNYRKDLPAGLEGGGYYFTITADRPSGFPWLYVGAGTAAAAGAAIYFLSKKEEQVTITTPPGVPLPPPRP
jgi:hypothetical protein